jgi:hypothetical protein
MADSVKPTELLFTSRVAQAMVRARVTVAENAAAVASDDGKELGRGGRDIRSGSWRIVTRRDLGGVAPEIVIGLLPAEPVQ